MKDIKRRYEAFSFFDHTGIAAHLEKMAAHGWMLDKITNFWWVYRRIEPTRLQFAVSYYPKASAFDPEPTEDQRAFQDFCAHSGWMLATASAQMQIFYNENEDAVPIETDPTLEIETIHRAAKKSFLPLYFFLLAITILDWVMFVSRLLRDTIGVLSSTSSLFSCFAWTMLLLLCVAELAGYFSWRAKAKKAALHGEFLATAGRSWAQRVILAVVVLGFVCWMFSTILMGAGMLRIISLAMILYMAALLILVNGVKQLLKKKKAPAGVNRTLTMICTFVLAFAMMGAITYGTLRASRAGWFEPELETYEYKGSTFAIYRDELPLDVEAMLDVGIEGYSKSQRTSDSLLLSQSVIFQRPLLDEESAQYPYLDYTITRIKAPFLYEICKNSLLNQRQNEVIDGEIVFQDEYIPIDAAPWGAQSAYQLHWSDSVLDKYLLCYEDCIVEISFGWQPTTKQMAIVGEKLGS